MKKIVIFLGLLFISFALVSCDGMFQDDTLSVVFYTGKGATVIETVYDLEIGDKVPEPEVPISDAGEFDGWYTDIAYTQEWVFESNTISKSITLYAKWNYFTFTINYDLRGGNWPGNTMPTTYPTSYTYFSTINFPTKASDYPKSDNKGIFLGWWEEPDLTSAQRKSIPKTEKIEQGNVGNKVYYAYYSRDN